MRKFTFFALLLLVVSSLNAQLTFEATADYGKLWDIKYDQKVPDRLYALSLVNHLMVSEDNGVTWQILYTHPNEKANLGSLKISADGNALTFIVKNDADLKSNGIYVYDLASNTVQKHYVAPNWTDNPSIVSYSFYSGDVKAILLHTSYQIGFTNYTKVFYTGDDGANWNEIYFSSNYNDVHINNVAISPDDPQKLFLARSLGSAGTNGGLFISMDAGGTFTEKLPGIAVDPIAFNPDNADTMWTGSGISFGATPENLFRSSDGGATWDTVAMTWTDQTLNNITTIAYDPVDHNIMWLLDENETAKSTDGGLTWSHTSYTPDNVTYTYGTGITFNPFNHDQLFITSDGYPQYSSDGGSTLVQAKNPFNDVFHVAFGNYAGTKHLYHSYSFMSGYVDKNLSTDSSTAYNVQTPFIINARVMVPIPDSTVPGRVFIYTAGDGFFNTATLQLSNNYGATLTNLPVEDYSTGIKLIKKDPHNPNVYWTSYTSFGNGTLYKIDISDSNNVTSQQITTVTGENIAGIAFSATDSNTIYIVQGVKVYKSTNGGLNWDEKITGLDNLDPVADVINDMDNNPLNKNQFILATNRGLYLSNDSTENWALSVDGYDIHKVSFSPVVNGHIIAASHTTEPAETQLVYTTNGGANWMNIVPRKLDHLHSHNADFAFYKDSIDVYFSTVDLGVVRYSLTNLPNVLPLRLLTFSGSSNSGSANLTWQTTNEHNVLQYELERSTDEQNFEKINVASAANTAGNHAYHYEDRMFKTLSEKNAAIYYRLKMLDIDGRFTYSSIVKLNSRTNAAAVVSIYPNPVKDAVNLYLQTRTSQKYMLKVTDVSGKEYIRTSYTIPRGNTSLSVPVANLGRGTYVLILQNESGEIKQLRFVK